MRKKRVLKQKKYLKFVKVLSDKGVAIPFPRGSSHPGMEPGSSVFPASQADSEPPRKVPLSI